MSQNERLQALHLLTKLLKDQISLMQSQHLPPLVKEISFGVCRHYYFLRTITYAFLKNPPKEVEIEICILIGLYQLHFLRIPDYACVKETVGLLDKIKKSWAKGLVNAVLRRYCREGKVVLAQLKLGESEVYNHSSWMIHRFQKDWPKAWQTILEANNARPPMNLRVNRRQTSREKYLSCLEHENLQAIASIDASEGLQLTVPCNVQDLPGFAQGEVSVQDLAAQMAIPLLDLSPGFRVLDACCAPGGKTCHILEAEPNLSLCVALDINTKRLQRVQENLQRLKLNAQVIQGDALKPHTWWDGIPFDRILLDAPCSATGVIRRHPDIKLLRTEAEIDQLVALQKNLLHTLWPLLAPGGLLVYATCSILLEENEAQIAEFVSTQQDAQCILHPPPWGHATGHGWQILPGEHQMDGFFYSVLRRKP